MKKLFVLIVLVMFITKSVGQIRGTVFNLNGIRGKDISVLFDGKIDQNYNLNDANDPLAMPYEGWYVLDSIYNLGEFRYYVTNAVPTQGFKIRFYDINRKEVGSYINTPTINKYHRWNMVPIPRKGVRFIQFQVFDMQVNWDGIVECEFYGQAISKAPSIYPPEFNYVPVDLGVYAHGVNTLGDRINKVVAPGDTVLRRVAKAVRWYWQNSEFDYYPETYFGKLENSRTYLGRFGNNHSGNLLNSFVRWDIRPMMSAMGGSIKWIKDTSVAKKNDVWLGNAMEDRKYLEPAADPETDSAWRPLAKRYSSLISLYGKSKGVTNSFGGDTTSGQGQMDVFEWDNEAGGWWRPLYFHSPRAYYKALSSIYKAGKSVDPAAKIYAGALPGIDTAYWKAVYFMHYLENGLTPFPADGFNFNMYLNDGTQQQEGTTGISPESYKIYEVLQSLKGFLNRHFGKPVQWTEFGYATDALSPYDVPDRQTQADYTLRLKAICQSIPFIDRMYYYAFFQDGTGTFNSMGLFRDSTDWKTVIPYPVAYALAQELYIERDAPWFSEIVRNGGDTGLWITRKGNLLKLWHPNGEGNYYLPDPSKVYKLRYDSWLPDSVVTNIVPVGQGMTWIVQENSQDTIQQMMPFVFHTTSTQGGFYLLITVIFAIIAGVLFLLYQNSKRMKNWMLWKASSKHL